MTEQASILSRLGRMDRRFIYVIILIAVSIPLLRPMGLPLSLSSETKLFYDYVNSLGPGAPVVLAFDLQPGALPELYPQMLAILQHLKVRQTRIICVAFMAEGAMIAQNALSDAFGSTSTNPNYGKTFVNLGYIAGAETGIAAFAKNVKGAAPQDYYGKPTAGMEVLSGVDTAKDFSLVIEFAYGTPGIPEMMRQMQSPYGVKIAAAATALIATQVMPYLKTGQVVGMLTGLRGAAEYENLIGKPGSAVAGMDAQSVSHVVIIIAIFLGNIGYYYEKRRKPQ
jgi:hypothetical protein